MLVRVATLIDSHQLSSSFDRALIQVPYILKTPLLIKNNYVLYSHMQHASSVNLK